MLFRSIKLGDSLLLHVLTNVDSLKSIVWTPTIDSSKCPKGSFCTEQWVRPIVGTTYKATVTDKNGCKVTGMVHVSIDKLRPVYVPTAFSPNNDGNNDILLISGSQAIRNIKRFEIFDRWGNQMFAAQNFKADDPAFGWDGKIRGKDALPAVYVYYLEVEFMDNSTDIIEGDFTLMR